MATLFWTSGTSGSWDDPANWSGATVPTATDDAVISAPGNYVISVGNVEVNSITLLDPGAAIDVNGDLSLHAGMHAGMNTVNDGALSIGGTALISAVGGSSGIAQAINVELTGASTTIDIVGDQILDNATIEQPIASENQALIEISNTVTFGPSLTMISASISSGANPFLLTGPGTIYNEGTFSATPFFLDKFGGPGPKAEISVATFENSGVVRTYWPDGYPIRGTLYINSATFHNLPDGIVHAIDGNIIFSPSTNLINEGTIIIPPPCFAAGTRISTERGEVAVEDVRVGDRVRILSGAMRPVVWIGHREVGCTRHPQPQTVQPVCVAAGAFGPMQPKCNLFLSPDHAVFVDGVLIPIKYLLNGSTIRQVKRKRVTYYHVELPEHSVLLAEGLAVESYLDTGDRANFSGAGRPIRLHPDFSSHVWEAEGCAPLVVSGPHLEAAQRLVGGYAGEDRVAS